MSAVALRDVVSAFRRTWPSPADVSAVALRDVVSAFRRTWPSPADVSAVALRDVVSAFRRTWPSPADVSAVALREGGSRTLRVIGRAGDRRVGLERRVRCRRAMPQVAAQACEERSPSSALP